MRPLLAFLTLAGLTQTAGAFEIPTGIDDLAVHWDNTITAGLGWRAQGIDPVIGNNVTTHQSDYKFPNAGDMWKKRIDVLSEFDVVFRDNYGFRVSAAGWYDAAYDNHNYGSNPNLFAFRSRTDGFDSYTKRYYNGPSGELLDAFAFGNFNPGGHNLSMKVGQYSLVWGVSQVSIGEALSYGQQPMNFQKSAENPGISPKEIALPLPQVSFQADLVPKVSLAGYYQLAWRPNRLSEGGTYLGAADPLWQPTAGVPVAPGVTLPISEFEPPSHPGGNYGVQLSLTPEVMGGGNVSLVYRRFDEKQPWPLLVNDASFSGFHNSFARGVQLFGVSSNFGVGGISVGAEMNYTKNGALSSTGIGQDGARGDTWHALLNGMKMFGTTPLWNSSVLIAELGYTHLVNVNSRPDLFNGEGYACVGGQAAGCATKNTVTGSLIFQPMWFNVPFDGVNLTGNLVLAGYGIKGTTPNLIGGQLGSYTWGIGVTADIRNRYKLALQYTGYGARKAQQTTDRGNVILTFSTTL